MCYTSHMSNEMGVEMNISDMDRAWAEMAAGRAVSDDEVAEFKTDYEQWISEMESSDSPEIIGCDSNFVIH